MDEVFSYDWFSGEGALPWGEVWDLGCRQQNFWAFVHGILELGLGQSGRADDFHRLDIHLQKSIQFFEPEKTWQEESAELDGSTSRRHRYRHGDFLWELIQPICRGTELGRSETILDLFLSSTETMVE